MKQAGDLVSICYMKQATGLVSVCYEASSTRQTHPLQEPRMLELQSPRGVVRGLVRILEVQLEASFVSSTRVPKPQPPCL